MTTRACRRQPKGAPARQLTTTISPMMAPTVQGEFSTLKSYLARRPEAEPWPKTYSALKVICAANPELMPTQEVLLDISLL